MKICTYCGSQVPFGDPKCGCGGTDFKFRCDNCGSEYTEGQYCPNCGTRTGQKPRVCPKCSSEYYTNACPNCGYVNNGTAPGAESTRQTGVTGTPVEINVNVNTSTPQPKKKRKTWLWVLGWVFIFPVPLTILMVRNKKMSKVSRAIIIAVAWLLYFAIAFSGGKDKEKPSADSASEIQRSSVSSCVHASTELTGYVGATCTAKGYSGDTVCRDCGEIIRKGSETEKTAHVFRDGKCTVCGAKDPSFAEDCKHQKTEVKNARQASCTAAGYTGDTVCKDCGAVIKKGTETQKTEHTYVNGACSVCGAKDPSVSAGQQNALSKARSYLSFSQFSYNGLYDQLKFEGYTDSEAKYGVDNCGADWKEQAKGKAKSYLKTSSFSYAGLVDQLEYEQFTSEEAKYGVDNCGADWNSQAVEKAKSYLKFSAFSYQGIIDQLEYEQFTAGEAKYGADNCGADWKEQAVAKAKSYLKFGSFSYQRLVDQLEYEGFTSSEAKYGADNCGQKLD